MAKQATEKQGAAGTLTSPVREAPSAADIDAARQAAAVKDETYVKVQAAGPNRMWDPDHSQWIDGERPTLATKSEWLVAQIEARKIRLVE